jgi:putative flippase GtrA
MKAWLARYGREDLRFWSYRIFKFGVVGTSAALLYFVLLYCMVEFANVPVMIATAIAYLIVSLQNYFLHHLWTFESEESHSAAFPKFIVSNAAGFAINWAIMYFGVHVMHVYYLLVQAVSVLAIISWNLGMGVLWIFGNTRKP